jgi:hypothetical protein
VHRQVTTQKEEALKEVDVAVIGHNAVQQAGVMAQRGALALLLFFLSFSFFLASRSSLIATPTTGKQAITREPGSGSP